MVRRWDASVVGMWLIFFLNGAVLASWAPRIPDVKGELGLSDGALGIALAGVAVGSVPALFATGALLRRVPADRVCRIAAVVLAAALPSIALARNVAELTAALAVLGAASGCLDVAMNTVGIRYEAAGGRRVLSRLHGGLSLGVLAGAAAGALCAQFGIAVGWQFGAVAVVLIALALVASGLLPAAETPRRAPESVARVRAAGLPLPLLALAVAALLMEGMTIDWSAVLIGRDYGGGFGAFAVTGFSCAMFASRSLGDVLAERIGAGPMAVAAALLLVSAVTIGLLQSTPIGVLIAVMIVGVVIGPLFPMAVSAAGRMSSDPAAATARISAVGYLAFLAGPPLVGGGAELLSLPATFAIVSILCGLAIASGRHQLSRADTRRRDLEVTADS